MTELPFVLTSTALAVLASMTLLWIASVALKNASIVDIFWGPGFAMIAIIAFLCSHGLFERKLLLTVLTSLWGLRLGLYLAFRNVGHGEDPRYVSMRENAENEGKNFATRSFVRVFLLQGFVMWFVSLPVQLAQVPAVPDQLGLLALLGTIVFLIGFGFEAIGDWQLARFKANAANKGKVMDQGLWRYTRHPNYFGNACLWWGLFIIAAETPVAWSTILSPVLMTFLLLKVSGVALLEKSLSDAKPGYRDYIRKTSAFIPRPPKAD